MSSANQPRGRRGRWSRYLRPEEGLERVSRQYGPGEDDLAAQEAHFGVSRDQIEHDFTISRVLSALAPHADRFVFYGGTALSRTFLAGLRLSEDIDLLTVGPRRELAGDLDRAIRTGLERDYGQISARPWLADAITDTTASTFMIGDVRLKVQLIDGRAYAAWPRQKTTVRQRYSGIPDVNLTTYTAAGFVGAKTVAWCDATRNAPRDLYDLWALAQAGFIDREAAETYKRCGPTGGVPKAWSFPKQPPSEPEWADALGHQCILRVGPEEAYEVVTRAWYLAAEG